VKNLCTHLLGTLVKRAIQKQYFLINFLSGPSLHWKEHKEKTPEQYYVGNDLSAITQHAYATKIKNKSIVLHQTKNLLIAKETINSITWQSMDWENICKNIFDKELISKIYKELIQLGNGKMVTN
jgi:hypothetical protein